MPVSVVFLSADPEALLESEVEPSDFSNFSTLRQESFTSHTHLLRLEDSSEEDLDSTNWASASFTGVTLTSALMRSNVELLN